MAVQTAPKELQDFIEFFGALRAAQLMGYFTWFRLCQTNGARGLEQVALMSDREGGPKRRAVYAVMQEFRPFREQLERRGLKFETDLDTANYVASLANQLPDDHLARPVYVEVEPGVAELQVGPLHPAGPVDWVGDSADPDRA